MEQDAELSAQSPNDDLDEGESARLGEDHTGLIQDEENVHRF